MSSLVNSKGLCQATLVPAHQPSIAILIRASIYSTNMIESFNNVIKRKAKPKAEFPTEQSLDTFIGIQAMSYNERYFNRIHKGFGQVQDTLESYFD